MNFPDDPDHSPSHFLGAGVRACGRTHCFAGSAVETEFFALLRMPIVPLRSHLVTEWSPKKLRTTLSVRSVLVAYSLWWGSLLTVAFGFGALRMFERSNIWVLWAVLAGVSLAAALWAGKRSWQLSATDEKRRVVYAKESGQPFDPAMLPLYEANELKLQLGPRLAEEAKRLGIGGYRDGQADEEAWVNVAHRPEVDDLTFLRGALTMARVEMALSSGVKRRMFALLHRDVWRRIEPRITGEETLTPVEDA